MADLDNTIRRFTSLAQAQDKAFAAGAAAVPSAARNLSMSYAVGTRVLDLVTGVEGTVVHGQRENVIIPATGNAGS